MQRTKSVVLALVGVSLLAGCASDQTKSAARNPGKSTTIVSPTFSSVAAWTGGRESACGYSWRMGALVKPEVLIDVHATIQDKPAIYLVTGSCADGADVSSNAALQVVRRDKNDKPTLVRITPGPNATSVSVDFDGKTVVIAVPAAS